VPAPSRPASPSTRRPPRPPPRSGPRTAPALRTTPVCTPTEARLRHHRFSFIRDCGSLKHHRLARLQRRGSHNDHHLCVGQRLRPSHYVDLPGVCGGTAAGTTVAGHPSSITLPPASRRPGPAAAQTLATCPTTAAQQRHRLLPLHGEGTTTAIALLPVDGEGTEAATACLPKDGRGTGVPHVDCSAGDTTTSRFPVDGAGTSTAAVIILGLCNTSPTAHVHYGRDHPRRVQHAANRCSFGQQH